MSENVSHRDSDNTINAQPKSELSRRELLLSTLAAGFALAVRPISAQTITTDTNGLTAGMVEIQASDRTIPAYRAMPTRGRNFPVVMVVHEIFGVHEYIKDICRRFAKVGHLAIAPDLYIRHGDVSNLPNFQEIIRSVVSRVPDAQVMSDLDATIRYARGTRKAHRNKLALTGFCWGGRIVWLYAAHNPQLKAGAAWYGRLVPTANAPRNPLQPQHPIDVAARLRAPVLGLYGGADGGIPNETVEQMRAALRAANSSSDIMLYPNMPHGFHADYRESYRPEQAADAWRRMLEWFRRHGAA